MKSTLSNSRSNKIVQTFIKVFVITVTYEAQTRLNGGVSACRTLGHMDVLWTCQLACRCLDKKSKASDMVGTRLDIFGLNSQISL